MSSRKFKFISPGIFIKEIDNSQLLAEPTAMGPAIIGRLAQGPALKPIQVNSFSDFVDIFGKPLAGNQGGDVWRFGNFTAPTYAAYAAQAWLRNNSPVTMVRLLGQTNSNANDSTAWAGWKTSNIDGTSSYSENGGAYGLFICEGTPGSSIIPTTSTPWPSGSAITSGTAYASASITMEATASMDTKPIMLTGSAGSHIFTATGAFDPSWVQDYFLTGASETEAATNLAALINASASADFSSNSDGAVVHLTASAIGSTANSNSLTSSLAAAYSVTGSTIGTDTLFSGGESRALGAALNGTLAAVWYLNNGAIALSGQTIVTGSNSYSAGMATFVRAADSGPTFKVVIQGSSASDTVIDSSFNFDPTSARYIRKVFNTNPTLTNATLNSSRTLNYWLGESFEGNLKSFKGTDSSGSAVGVSGSTPSSCYGVILRLASPDGSTDGADFRMSKSKSPSKQFAKTGWFISQDLSSDSSAYNPSAMQKLFRLCGREMGEETQRKIKVSIKDIKASVDTTIEPYGSFTVVIREVDDTDANPQILEQYNKCNLNPASDNYIATLIGDRFEQWDDAGRRYRSFGDYPNSSNYVYVEMNNQVDRGTANTEYLPFGVFGPPRYLGFAVSGSDAATYDYSSAPQGGTGMFVEYGSANPMEAPSAGTFNTSSEGQIVNAKFKFPALRLRASSSEGGTLSDPRDAYFGADTSYRSSRFDQSVLEVLRGKAEDTDPWDASTGLTEYSWVFSLDDVRNIKTTSSTYTGSYGVHAVYESGSRVNGTSYTIHTGSKAASEGTLGPASASYQNVIDDVEGGTSAGWNQFTTCLHGGSDGLDITERDAFNNSDLEEKTETTWAPYNSINVAIDSLRDPEVVEYNLIAMPGITNNTLNTKLVEMCENRADALAVIDLKDGYTPDTENDQSRTQRKGSVANVIKNKKRYLLINSSYGCAYYPWVQIRDTINGATLWAPPSVVAIGAMSYSEANSQLWFAPAGFTRGGLSANRAAGIPVVGVEERLTSRQRDDLYEANINPIATFPAEGIVIFGQKTLQLQASALDRINVRRLLLFLKKQVSRFAATILFDQNVQVTWNRFKSKVEPFLSDVKAGLGITDYKLVLDETTTTPDLIDRNILYAKIYIKPARAIEYIAIDFIITDSGASFED